MMKYSYTFLMMLFSVIGWTQNTTVYLDSLTDSIRKEHNIPALAVAYVTPDNFYYGIAGTTKINNDEKVTLKSKFHIGSNTKAVTSFIAMKLIEENKISIETKFFDLFMGMKSDRNASYHEITFGDLLSHNAKIPPYTAGNEFTKLPEFQGTPSEKRKAFSEFLLKENFVEKGTYSNAGYVLAALMMEKVSGKSYEELLQSTFSDLKLDYFMGFPNKENIHHPWGHWIEFFMNVPLEPDHFYQLEDFMASAGDLSMNLVDYSKFIQLHLKGLFVADNYLKTDSYKKLHSGLQGMSYGWGNFQKDNQVFSYHDGSTGTFYTHLLISHETQTAVIVFANAADVNTRKGIYALREKVMQNSSKFVNNH